MQQQISGRICQAIWELEVALDWIMEVSLDMVLELHIGLSSILLEALLKKCWK